MSTTDGPNGSGWEPTDNWAAQAPGEGQQPPQAPPSATGDPGQQPPYFGGQPISGGTPTYGSPAADQPNYGAWGMAPVGVQSNGMLVVGADEARKKWLAPLLIGLVVAVILASLGGFVLWKKLAAHGGQPEAVVPADAIAYVEVDLDPSAGQKLKVRDELRKIPELKDKIAADATDLKRSLFEAVLAGVPLVDYDTDIKPWLGDRAAVAVLPGTDTTPQVIYVIQHKDKAKAEAQMRKLLASTKGGSGTGYGSASLDPLGVGATALPRAFTMTDEYIVMGQSQSAVDAAVASAKTASLAGAKNYASDLATIGSDQIVTAWADLDAATGLLSAMTAPALQSPGQKSGRVVMGIHAFDNGFEMSGRLIGATGATEVAPRAADLLNNLPAGSAAALYVANPGEIVTKVVEGLKKSMPEQLKSVEKDAAQYGITVPGDIANVLGTDLVAAMGPIGDLSAMPGVGVLVRPRDVVKAQGVVEKLAKGLPDPTVLTDGLQKKGSDLVWTTPDAFGKEYAAGTGGLASTQHFKKAMVIDGDLLAGFFIDSSIAPASAKVPSGAIGFTETKSGSTVAFTLRVVID
jgi:hypothetical protein